jgi:hypothetical protein
MLHGPTILRTTLTGAGMQQAVTLQTTRGFAAAAVIASRTTPVVILNVSAMSGSFCDDVAYVLGGTRPQPSQHS